MMLLKPLITRMERPERGSREARKMEEISRKIAAVDLTFFDRYSSSGVAKLRAEDPSTQVKEPRKGKTGPLGKLKSKLRRLHKSLGSATEGEGLPATPAATGEDLSPRATPRSPFTAWLADITTVGTSPPESPILAEAHLDIPATPRSKFVAWLAQPPSQWNCAPNGSPTRETQFLVGSWWLPDPVPEEVPPTWKQKLQAWWVGAKKTLRKWSGNPPTLHLVHHHPDIKYVVR